uniref:Si:dkey-234i14.14 n=1 Tax=Amphiprion percula TaxID=161767 RepID=A0A3P8T0E6_AMPPE
MFLTPLITLLLGLQGSAASPSVIQSPASKSVGLGETVSLSCSASTGVDDDLSWYLQKAGQPPKLLFYQISTRESDTPSHFSSSGSEPEFTLTISGVQAGDAGVYYCLGVYRGPVFTQ